jgi:hypothetical protein
VVKNKIYSGTTATGVERPQYRTGLDSEHSMEQWRFISKEQGGDL